MPIRLSRILPLLLVLSIVASRHCLAGNREQDSSATAVTSENVYTDVASFAAELQRIGTTIKKEKANAANMAALRGKLPVKWELTTAGRSYSLSAEPLRTLLRDAEKEKKPEIMAAKATAAADWALELADQVNAYARAQTHSTPSARPALERILSQRDFASVSGPTRWDLLRQRIVRWIFNLLERFFRQVGRYPIGARILFWLIVIAVVVWLALTLIRYWTKRAVLEELHSPDAVAFARTWQEWIRAAREAAQSGDFREAVHSTYWAGICYLEESGVVRKDRTRTPREYMKMVSNATQLAGSGRTTRESLSALTTVLEQVWYGRRPASNQDFASAMRNVEGLGCQLQ